MKCSIKIYAIVSIGIMIFIHGTIANSHAFTKIDPEFDSYSYVGEGTGNDLDWSVRADEAHTGSIALGFSVTIGGATYDHFDMDSNGYIELLAGAQTPEIYSYGYIDSLTDSGASTSTYLLGAYDDLSSYYYGYYGYKLYSERAVFYYDTATYDENDLLNNFEIILHQNGDVQWNFNYANYEDYDHDLFSGLYFGNTGTLSELYRDEIPEYESWSQSVPVPIPGAAWLLGYGLIGIAGIRRKFKK
jgi:hypothetical protein